MREAFNKLSADERHLLSEIAVNPVYKRLLEVTHRQTRMDQTQLNPDDELFNAKYRALQFHADFLEDQLKIVQQLFNEFYALQQSQNVEE